MEEEAICMHFLCGFFFLVSFKRPLAVSKAWLSHMGLPFCSYFCFSVSVAHDLGYHCSGSWRDAVPREGGILISSDHESASLLTHWGASKA